MLAWVIIQYHRCYIIALSGSQPMPWGLLLQLQLRRVKIFPPLFWPSLPPWFHTSYTFCSWVRKSLCFSKCLRTSTNWVNWKELRNAYQGADRWEKMGTQSWQVVVSVWGPFPLGRFSQHMRFYWDMVKINQWTKPDLIRSSKKA